MYWDIADELRGSALKAKDGGAGHGLLDAFRAKGTAPMRSARPLLLSGERLMAVAGGLHLVRVLFGPINIGGHLRDIGHLTTEQQGAYLLLILRYWSKGSPDDDDLSHESSWP